MHIRHRLRSLEEKAWNRPQSLSAGDVVNEKVRARLGTQPTSTNINKKQHYFEIILSAVHIYIKWIYSPGFILMALRQNMFMKEVHLYIAQEPCAYFYEFI